MTHRLRSLLAGLIFVPLCTIYAQDTTVISRPPAPVTPVDTLRCSFCPRPSVPKALFEGLLIDALLNRTNAWLLNDSTARVTPETWRQNFRRGWDWDNDDFVVNMIGHPLLGSAYFASARTNGLSYWASAPITMLHSVGWEYFGETTQPSVNDLVNTSLGGIALGEMFHRVAETIRSNEATGTARVLREIAAIPFDPVGSVNRLLRGDWGRQGPNSLEHNPVGTVLWTGVGAGIVRSPGTSAVDFKDASYTSILFADFKYGDAYLDTLRKPFDAFSLRIFLAPGHGDLTQLVGVGRITGKAVGSESHPRQLELNQRFEYVNNGALQFGAQTIQFGLSTRSHLIERFWVRTLVAADAIVLAGINAPGAGTGPRTYDFGPGIGGTVTASIERGTVPYLTLRFQPAYTHTLDGAKGADHVTSFSAVEANVPIIDRLSLVVHGTYYTRLSTYADGTHNSRSFPELLVFAAFRRAR